MFTWPALRSEECDSFPKLLDSALSPIKTNEGAKNDETPSNMINPGTLSLV